MCEDITYCYHSKCKNKKCERHQDNIKVHYILHSFAFFTSCKYWDRPMEYIAPSNGESGEQDG